MTCIHATCILVVYIHCTLCNVDLLIDMIDKSPDFHQIDFCRYFDMHIKVLKIISTHTWNEILIIMLVNTAILLTYMNTVDVSKSCIYIYIIYILKSLHWNDCIKFAWYILHSKRLLVVCELFTQNWWQVCR